MISRAVQHPNHGNKREMQTNKFLIFFAIMFKYFFLFCIRVENKKNHLVRFKEVYAQKLQVFEEKKIEILKPLL